MDAGVELQGAQFLWTGRAINQAYPSQRFTENNCRVCRGEKLELKVTPCHRGIALPSKDRLWWPSQQTKTGLVTAVWVSHGPAVTRQVHRDRVGPKSSLEVKSVCDDQHHKLPDMGVAATQLGQRTPERGKMLLVEVSHGSSSNSSFQGCTATRKLIWP